MALSLYHSRAPSRDRIRFLNVSLKKAQIKLHTKIYGIMHIHYNNRQTFAYRTF